MEEKISLLELQLKIKKGIESSVSGPVWVTAEIGELKNHPNGHCYLELIDYKEGEKSVAAKARATIWSSTYRIIRPYFETTAGVRLSPGINVLVKAQVSFSVIYGLSLNILDIDPSFTVGELELKRQNTIKRLRQEGCMDMNAQLPIPPLPRRIAVVSSPSAAGYRDFIKQLQGNECGYRFIPVLFPAQMQGEDAPKSMIAALDLIALRQDEFDVAVVIRGGGAAMDLVCFDDYELASNIAQFPLPVITGIGHDHDFHIADMVAHTWVKTPTAVADFLVDLFAGQESLIMDYYQRISLSLTHKISAERAMLDRLRQTSAMAAHQAVSQRRQQLEMLALRIRARLSSERAVLDRMHDRAAAAARQAVAQRRQHLELLELRVKAADPARILQNGFALVAVDGHRAKAGDIAEGRTMRLVLQDGAVEFMVGKIIRKENSGRPEEGCREEK